MEKDTRKSPYFDENDHMGRDKWDIWIGNFFIALLVIVIAFGSAYLYVTH